MAKRIKSEKPALIPIRDWQQADEIIKEISDYQIAIEKIEAIAKQKIDNTKKVLAEAVKGHQDIIKKYQESLEAFATAHRNDFKSQKSRKLNFGVLGWRKSTAIKTAKNTLELIKLKLSKTCQRVCIRIKESVDKDALARLTDEQLAGIKARREEKDVFFVEPLSQKAADYE
ncbi:MAG: hypothetical protein AMJ75_09345 [Phycisphaerae bacterium SM1_79]|nr:MAG: hypothetical protein AMJ75_09345 [Phycisphaerae bacterium SM1_79]